MNLEERSLSVGRLYWFSVKNNKRILTHSNLPFRTTFAGGRSVIGRGSEAVLSGQVASISGNSDQLLTDGVEWLEMEHLVEENGLLGRPR
jgi:hypothetical protein